MSIVKGLKKGDVTVLAELTGYSRNYVTRVLKLGDRRNESIVETAKKYISQRDSLKTTRKK